MDEKGEDDVRYGGARQESSGTISPVEGILPSENQQMLAALPNPLHGNVMIGARNQGPFAGAQISGDLHLHLHNEGSTRELLASEGVKELFDRKSKEQKENKESERYQKLCKVAEKHVRTSLYYEVLAELENKNSVLLLANAGDGKSTILKLVSLEYKKKDFLTIQIKTAEEVANYNIEDRRVLFICDNLLGETNINSKKIEAWLNCESDDFVTSAKEVKFLFACRQDFWGRFKTTLEGKEIFENEVDVRSARLTLEDKMKMLHQYLGEKVSDPDKVMIAQNSSFAFPECCRLVSHNLEDIEASDTLQLLNTFSNPFKLILKQLDRIATQNKLQYAVLVFCLLNDRKFPKTSTSMFLQEAAFRERLAVVQRIYLADRMSSAEQLYDTLLDKAKELDGWLLAQDGYNYDFYHSSIFEAMCRVHGSRYPEHILNFCKAEVVFSVFTTKRQSGLDSGRVTLTPCCYQKLVEIVTDDCLKGPDWCGDVTWGFVFKELNVPDIVKEWQRFLSERMPGGILLEDSAREISLESNISEKTPTLADVLILISKLPNSHLTVSDAVERAAYHGDVETCRSLTDAFLTGETNVQKLVFKAIEGGNIGTLRMLLQREDLDRDNIHSYLWLAVRHGKAGCVREIMALHPDTKAVNNVLEISVFFGYIKALTELLKRKIASRQVILALLNKPDEYIFLQLVSQPDRDKIRKLLLTYLDSLTSDVDRRALALWTAAGEGDVKTLTDMLRQTDLDGRDILLGLQRAVFCDRAVSVKELIKLDLQKNTIDIVLAIVGDGAECLKELLKRDLGGDTILRALKVAVLRGHVNTAKELLKQSVVSRQRIQTMLDTPDKFLFWPDTSITARGEIRRLLLSYLHSLASDVDKTAVELWRAAGEGQVETLRHILQQKEPETQDIKLAFRRAAFCNKAASLREFLNLDLDTDTKNDILKWTVWYDNVECLREFLKKDIDTDTLHKMLAMALQNFRVKAMDELFGHPAISGARLQEKLNIPETRSQDILEDRGAPLFELPVVELRPLPNPFPPKGH